MLALYLAYRLLLARDNQHGFNRGVLLAIYAVSFAAYPVLQLVSGLKGASSPQTGVTGAVEVIGKAEVADSMPVWGTILLLVFVTIGVR